MTKQHHETNIFATDLRAACAHQTVANGRFVFKEHRQRTPHAQRLRWQAQGTTLQTPAARSVPLVEQKWLGRRVATAQVAKTAVISHRGIYA